MDPGVCRGTDQDHPAEGTRLVHVEVVDEGGVGTKWEDEQKIDVANHLISIQGSVNILLLVGRVIRWGGFGFDDM
jgi:hypothetical protein